MNIRDARGSLPPEIIIGIAGEPGERREGRKKKGRLYGGKSSCSLPHQVGCGTPHRPRSQAAAHVIAVGSAIVSAEDPRLTAQALKRAVSKILFYIGISKLKHGL